MKRGYADCMASAGNRIKPPEALSDGQKDCLRLVMQHFSSKEIARSLGVSPHTVDKRLKLAISAMGVQGRVEAARKLAIAEGNLDHGGRNPNWPQPAYLFAANPDLEAQDPTKLDIAKFDKAHGDQALVYQSPDLSRQFKLGKSGSPSAEWNPADGRSDGMLHEGQAAFFGRSSSRAKTGLLGLVFDRELQVNDLSVVARLAAMAGIVSGSILAFAVFISVIEGLSRLY